MTVTLEQIRDAVAWEYGLTVEQLLSYRISIPYTEARRVFASIAWKYGTQTPQEISGAINRDNSWFYHWRNFRPPLDIEKRVLARLGMTGTVTP